MSALARIAALERQLEQLQAGEQLTTTTLAVAPSGSINPAPPPAAIAATALGITTAANGANSQITCASAVPMSRLVIAAGGVVTGGPTTQTITDSAGNSYTVVASNLGTLAAVLLDASNVATALSTSSTMRYAEAGSTGQTALAGASFTGCAANAAASGYAAATNTGTGTTATVTSGAVNANDLAVLAVIAAGHGVPSTPAGWTASQATAGAPGFGLFWIVPAMTGALSPAVNVASGNWAAAIAAFPHA